MLYRFRSLGHLKHAKWMVSSQKLKCFVSSRFFSSDGFLSGSSATYVEEMYEAWKKDPHSVHVSWQAYFKNVSAGKFPAFTPPPTLIPSSTLASLGYDGTASLSGTVDVNSSIPSGEILDHMKVQLMVRAYQVRGHHLAQLDPLEINFRDQHQAPELDYKHYGFVDSDLDRKFYLGNIRLFLF